MSIRRKSASTSAIKNGIHSQSQATNPRIVLFVCVENTFRSIMSEAIFNSAPAGGWRAESAGVSAVESINLVVVGLLKEIGIELGAKKPRQVTGQMISLASRVVTFGCLDRCPVGTEGKSEDWPLPGATGKSWMELQAIRDELVSRIAILKSSLQTDYWHVKR